MKADAKYQPMEMQAHENIMVCPQAHYSLDLPMRDFWHIPQSKNDYKR